MQALSFIFMQIVLSVYGQRDGQPDSRYPPVPTLWDYWLGFLTPFPTQNPHPISGVR